MDAPCLKKILESTYEVTADENIPVKSGSIQSDSFCRGEAGDTNRVADCTMLSSGMEDARARSSEDDVYFYTKRNDFTSEVFKIEVGNLPPSMHYGTLKTFLQTKMKLNPHKLKIITSSNFAFITFRCEDDREKALQALQGFRWKGRELKAKKANPMADPLIKKRKCGEMEDSSLIKRVKEGSDGPMFDSILDAVTPLWKMAYEDQLKKKEEEIRAVLIKLGRKMENINPSVKSWLKIQRKENNFLCCPLLPIRASPVTMGYRNKCEFSVGKDVELGKRVVGFRLSQYKEGSTSVAEPDKCIHISEAMKKAVKSFQEYAQRSDKEPFCPKTHSGYWKQLTVRTSRNNDVMLVVVMHPQSLSEEELTAEKNRLRAYFETGEGADCGITSLFFQPFAMKLPGGEEPPTEHLFGKKYLEETLLEMKFHISPEAFFQTNTAAAEVLYRTVTELANLTPETAVLDICCGTGAVGLLLSKMVCKVVGIDSCPQAVENATANATLNGITNAEFIVGDARDSIYSAIQRAYPADIVAIVDPPRGGLHTKVLKAIRSCQQIERLVYLSCNASLAVANFVDLCRPTSNSYRGSPFVPAKAMLVDLFPHTPHCELIILLKRLDKSVCDLPKD